MNIIGACIVTFLIGTGGWPKLIFAEEAHFVDEAITSKHDEKRRGNFNYKNYNLILISLTNVIANRLGSYGYQRDTSPNIDKFNEKAFMFRNAFTVTSWTSPGAASLLTSLYPFAHNLMRWHKDVKPLSKDILTIAEILKNNGYRTASFNGGADYDKVYGLDKGFETYFQGEPFAGFKDLISPTMKWLEENKDKKFFLHLQSFDVHAPYNPPEPFRSKYDPNYKNTNGISFNASFYNAMEQEPQIIDGEKYYAAFSSFPPRMIREFGDHGPAFAEVLLSERDVEHLKHLYDANLNYADSLLGQFLDKLDQEGLYDKTIVVFTSEHGELLFKNGRIMRGGIMRGNSYEDVVHIPLSIRIPGQEQGKELEGLASIVDIVPTVLDLLAIKYDDYGFQGKSLVPLIRQDKQVRSYVFGGMTFYGDIYNQSGSKFFYGKLRSNMDMIRSKKWKLIREKTKGLGPAELDNKGPKKVDKVVYELYDLGNDPNEEINVVKKYPEIFSKLLKTLEGWNAAVIRNQKPEPAFLKENLLKEMQLHGYW